MVQPLDRRLMTELTFFGKATEQDSKIDNFGTRVAAIETLGGLAPGDISDATMTSIAANGASTFAEQQRQSISKSTGTTYAANFATIQDAVSASVAAGTTLVISEPVVVSGNIPGFWNARISGVGSIVRGGATYAVAPRPDGGAVGTNTIYMDAQAGSDSNDGLSPGFAIKTLERLYYQILRRMSADLAAGAKWVVRMTGSFEGGAKFSQMPDFPHGLEFQGDDLIDGSPVTKVSKGASSSRIGLWFEPCPKTVHVKNLWFDGFKDAGSGYAILGKGVGGLQSTSCLATNVDIGFAAINNVDFFFKSCITDSTVGNAFRAQYSSSGTFDNCIVDGATTGFSINQNAVVHIDDCSIKNTWRGVDHSMAARSVTVNCNFENNQTAVRSSGASEWRDSNCEFNIGTPRANTRIVENFGVGRDARSYSEEARNSFIIGDSMVQTTTPAVCTGAVGEITAFTGGELGAVMPGYFTSPGKTIKVTAYGVADIKSDATVRVYVTVYGSSERYLAIETTIKTTAGSYKGGWKFEGEINAKTMTTQSVAGSLSLANNNTSVAVGVRSIDFAGRRGLRMSVGLAEATDSVTVHNVKVEMAG